MTRYLLLLLLPGLVCLQACQSPDPPPSEAAQSNRLPDNEPQAAEPVPVERAAPDFSIPAIGGDSLRMSDLRGNVVLVNFWATWCAPCRVEMPDLIALHDEYAEDAFTVIGIATDVEGEELVAPFVDELGINFPVGLDDGQVSEAFGGVYALPTTFVIDKEGIIRHRTIGLFPVERSRDNLEAMMAAD